MEALQKRVEKLTAILEVAKAMTEERDLDRLLVLIAQAATRVVGSERSSIFVYDAERGELWSKVAQGREGVMRFPANTGIAGAVATTGTVSNIADAYDDPRFNRRFDEESGFRTRTVLTVPMHDSRGGVVGVLQTLNKKDGGAFDSDDVELALALAGVAAAALVNALLNEEIDRLFDGFVQASIKAIESRDPSTAGHSGRVARLTCGLAATLQDVRTGRWAGTTFTHDQMRELRYASLLHDFGKVGVREHVLVKAEKLYPADMQAVRLRFEAIRRSLQAESARRVAELALRPGTAEERAREEAGLAEQLDDVDRVLDFVLAANRPSVLEEGSFERLLEVARRTWTDSRGERRPWLAEREVELLSVRKGTFATAERREIESHVDHTWRFLSLIPWTRTLRSVPEIARGHHEKPSGRGYPRGLAADAIPLQTRMMSIADVYDALTASDRPYKRAVAHERALDILAMEAKEGGLDGDLLRVFVEADIGRSAPPL